MINTGGNLSNQINIIEDYFFDRYYRINNIEDNVVQS